MKKNGKNIITSDDITILGKNYGNDYKHNNSPSWSSEEKYDYTFKVSNFVLNNENLPVLYFKTFTNGDNVRLNFQFEYLLNFLFFLFVA